MHVCYIDESGTSDIPGNTSHFILAGVSVPIRHWKGLDHSVEVILKRFGLVGEELHTAWILRKYLEQSRISGFEKLDWPARRAAVERLRNIHLLQLQKSGSSQQYRQAKKNYAHTRAYIHLTLDQRRALVNTVADSVSRWHTVRLFAECIDKTHFNPTNSRRTVDEQALEQIVSRFEQYLVNSTGDNGVMHYGLLVHDNNETVARKHTALMREFHAKGTLWTKINRIIETPLFVNSSLTSMVQIADLCCYALRRYLENGEADLFRKVFARADRVHNTVVGVRHFADISCTCEICQAHRGKVAVPTPAAPAEVGTLPSEHDPTSAPKA
ncbi:MAG: DUF3800 domain-containing protein [Candidatus Korobacteraceae bacterium]